MKLDVIKMAKEAGFDVNHGFVGQYAWIVETTDIAPLEVFAALVIEEAEKVCVDYARDCERLAEPIAANYLYECAAKISAMKEA